MCKYMDVDVVEGLNTIRTSRKIDHYESPLHCPPSIGMVPIPELREGELLHWTLGSEVPIIFVMYKR